MLHTQRGYSAWKQEGSLDKSGTQKEGRGGSQYNAGIPWYRTTDIPVWNRDSHSSPGITPQYSQLGPAVNCLAVEIYKERENKTKFS